MDVYTKLDLHIHSYKSGETKLGDKEYVKNSKIENLDVLVRALEENKINLCSITDHNAFDKDLYIKLKKYEKSSSIIKKVLPGIEIDLNMNGKIVHTICIFNDEDNEHVEKIDKNFIKKNNYLLSDLGDILANIGLEVVLIAHQKTDYKAESQHNTNLSNTGLEYFYRIIDIEYFDSLEVQSSKVEGILKSRFVEDNIDNCSLISGSDCHDWNVYPKHDSKSKCIPLLLYMKALPSFRGLVMSLTNPKRFVSDINRKKPFIKEIKYTKNEDSRKIKLSSGINAIIGDNSVGKSTLIKSILGIAPAEGTSFLNNHGISINKIDINETDYEFSIQGDIRKKFEGNISKLSLREEFKEQFIPINFDSLKSTLDDIFKKFTKLWLQNEITHKNITKIKNDLMISSFNKDNIYYINFDGKIDKKGNSLSGITKDTNVLINNLKMYSRKYGSKIEKEDFDILQEFYKFLQGFEAKYSNLELTNIFSNKLIIEINSTKENVDDILNKKKSSDEKAYNNFKDLCNDVVNLFIDVIADTNSIKINPFENFKTIIVSDIDERFGEYHFVSKMIDKVDISKELIEKFVKDKILISDIYSATSSNVLKKIKNKRFNEKVCNNLDELQKALLDEFSSKYLQSTVEIKYYGENLDEGNSAGTNALYYIDIKSHIYDRPLYIIDQPEDDVSQTKINELLIESLMRFSEKAQVIIITHNPQLVVNLDVDNVIIIKKEKNQEIDIINGPLELKDENIDILYSVANTLEGGINVIKKRWKRYDKANKN